MSQISVSDGIVPIGEFKANAARLLRQLRERGEPLVITQNGRAAAVLLSPEAYDALRDTESYEIAMERGARDLDSGLWVAGDRVMDWVESWGTNDELPMPLPDPR